MEEFVIAAMCTDGMMFSSSVMLERKVLFLFFLYKDNSFQQAAGLQCSLVNKHKMS